MHAHTSRSSDLILRLDAPFFFLPVCGTQVLRVRTVRDALSQHRGLSARYPAFRVLFPNPVIRADDLARAMVDVATRGTGKHGGLVFENRDIRAMVESLHTHE